MKIRWFPVAAVLVAGSLWYFSQKPSQEILHGSLPTEAEAKQLLDTTQRHREWVSLPVVKSGLRVYTVYPERSDWNCGRTRLHSTGPHKQDIDLLNIYWERWSLVTAFRTSTPAPFHLLSRLTGLGSPP